MFRMGSDAVFLFDCSVNVQGNREVQFVLINVIFYNFFPFPHIDADDNKSVISEFIV